MRDHFQPPKQTLNVSGDVSGDTLAGQEVRNVARIKVRQDHVGEMEKMPAGPGVSPSCAPWNVDLDPVLWLVNALT